MIEVKAELVGNLWKIVVEVGQAVEEDDTLMILESMKMEIPITTPTSGTVTQILVAEANPLNPPATGDLVVTLTWDTESNLNLHVGDPDGADIYWGNQSSQPPFAFNQPDSGSFGYIDYDSNANCVIDGLRREDVIWPDPPPSG